MSSAVRPMGWGNRDAGGGSLVAMGGMRLRWSPLLVECGMAAFGSTRLADIQPLSFWGSQNANGYSGAQQCHHDLKDNLEPEQPGVNRSIRRSASLMISDAGVDFPSYPGCQSYRQEWPKHPAQYRSLTLSCRTGHLNKVTVFGSLV